MFPTDPDGELEALAIDLVAKAARLSEAMHPITRAAVAELVRPMNSYYSNLIEGHDTHPIDIARALKQEYALDKKKKDLQLEAIAHIEVSAALANGRLPGLAGLDPSSAQFLKGVHKAFYDHLPESFKTVTSEEGEARTVVPGAWRTGEVKVGRHIAPAHGSVPAFIERFSAFYDRDAATNRSMVRRIIALAAAHHRLVPGLVHHRAQVVGHTSVDRDPLGDVVLDGLHRVQRDRRARDQRSPRFVGDAYIWACEVAHELHLPRHVVGHRGR